MDDTISRQDAIDVLDIGCELLRRVLDDTDVVGVERAKYEWGLGLIESYIADIKELPSAQQERMRGRWVPVTNGRGGYECDQCHNYAPSYQDGVEWLSDFCPNCGADMRQGEQE